MKRNPGKIIEKTWEKRPEHAFLSEEKRKLSTIRGTTSHPARLLFVCDDGRSYQIDSRPSEGSLCRFSIVLPRGRVWRLWIRREGSTFRALTFQDLRGELNSLRISLHAPLIDLGTIGVEQKSAFVHRCEKELLAISDTDRKKRSLPQAEILARSSINEISRHSQLSRAIR